MKDQPEPLIGWVGTISRMYPATANPLKDHYPMAWLNLIDDWQSYKIGESPDGEEISIDASDVKSIKILRSLHYRSAWAALLRQAARPEVRPTTQPNEGEKAAKSGHQPSLALGGLLCCATRCIAHVGACFMCQDWRGRVKRCRRDGG